MEKVIRDILDNYLDHKIVEKIEIKSIVSRDDFDEDFVCKAYGIPELLRLSFDVMGRSISSATCKNISDDIEDLCTDFMDKKMLYIKNIFKNEKEIIEVAKSLFDDNQKEENDDENILNDNKINELSEFNIYRNLDNPNYFVDNFCTSMNDKFKIIFNIFKSENIPLDEIKLENEEKNEIKENVEENEEEKENEKKKKM